MFSQANYGNLLTQSKKAIPLHLVQQPQHTLPQTIPVQEVIVNQVLPVEEQQKAAKKKISIEEISDIIENKVLRLEEHLLNLKKNNDDFYTEVREKVVNKKPREKKPQPKSKGKSKKNQVNVEVKQNDVSQINSN